VPASRREGRRFPEIAVKADLPYLPVDSRKRVLARFLIIEPSSFTSRSVAGRASSKPFLADLGLNWEMKAPLLLRPNDDPQIRPLRLAHLLARD
jgi:hypothetical protein